MNKNDYIIRLERKNDYRKTENVAREAFWNVYRPGCLEHFVLHELRNDENFIPELDFVIQKNNQIIGQVICLKAEIKADNGKIIPIITLGPIGILPTFRGQGYGKALLDYTLNKAKELGYGAVCLEGNLNFYGKSGFVVASTKGIHYYAEKRESEVPYFLCKELVPNFLRGISGVYETPHGYFVDEKQAELFDSTFPFKKKLKLPGQLI